MYAAIDASALNAFCHLDQEHATIAAGVADVALPFGGVPIGVKELDQVAGWPHSMASVPLRDEIATATSTQVQRIRDLGGAVLAGQTTASEFGGVNVTRTVLHGVTRNPWQLDRTPGGSSGGSAAAVAGGILTLATGGDGGGSIRIPGGFCGLVGLKTTFGRVPMSPNAHYGNLTSIVGCLARSVRDIARWFDVVNGHDPRDPLSLLRVEGWEAGLGTLTDQLRGLEGGGRPRLGWRRRIAGDVGPAGRGRRRSHPGCRPRARRRHRRRAAARWAGPGPSAARWAPPPRSATSGRRARTS